MSDINSIIKAEDLDNISDNDLYELDNEEKNSSDNSQSSDAENSSESENSSDNSSDSSSDNQSEYDDDSDSSVDFHDLDDNMPDNTEIIKSKNEILNEPIPDIEDIKNIKIDIKDQKVYETW
ncbi:unnamed protein product [Hanseniaspora opuntiae]